MNIKWVEDFLLLARLRSFSRAASARNVTQSGFSRRIRALERWVGAPLIDRGVYPAVLTEAGAKFAPIAADIVRQAHQARAGARRDSSGPHLITLAAQHSLSLSAFARWIAAIERRTGPLAVRMVADNYYGAVQSLREGGCDFLLCFTHPLVAPVPSNLFDGATLGGDFLAPVAAAGANGRARHSLPGRAGAPVPYLSYGSDTFLGRIVDLIVRHRPCALDLRYQNAFSEALKGMAVSGRGLAWLPQIAVAEDISAGRLIAAGDSCFRERLSIQLFRSRAAKSANDAFWRVARKTSFPTA